MRRQVGTRYDGTPIYVEIGPAPLRPLTAPRFFGLAARMLRLDPETVESDLIAIVKQHVTDPQQRGEAIILIRRATEFAPDHPLLRSLAAAAGIDSATFDSEWRGAQEAA